MEYMVVKCYSVIRKLYPNAENFDNDVSFDMNKMKQVSNN